MKSVAHPTTKAITLKRKPCLTLGDFIEAVGKEAETDNVAGVSRILENAVTDYPGFLPERFLVPGEANYARREIYSDPTGKFSIFAMVWAPGQATLLHDHGGLWVVEVVYQGQVSIRNFQHVGEEDGLHQFRESEERSDEVGSSDWRVPPEEHHVLANLGKLPAVTIHVFGGILNGCNIYKPHSGGYKKIRKEMHVD